MPFFKLLKLTFVFNNLSKFFFGWIEGHFFQQGKREVGVCVSTLRTPPSSYATECNIKIMINDEVDEITIKLFDSLKNRYQINLESMKGSEFIFNYV